MWAKAWITANYLMIVVTAVVCIWQMSWWFGQLPDVMPSHFDANGQVDGEMGKVAFFALMGGMQALFLIGFPILGRLIKRVPDSMVNIPNKEYWLAAERRDETMAFNSAILSGTGWLTGWLMIGTFQLTAQVAVKQRVSISPDFFWVMTFYLLGIAFSLGVLFMKFRIPKFDTSVQMTGVGTVEKK